jgi:hypothetical protein
LFADPEPGTDLGPRSACGAGLADHVVDHRVGVAVNGLRDGEGGVDPVQWVIAGGELVDLDDQLLERHPVHATTVRLSTPKGTTSSCRVTSGGMTLDG